MASAQSVPGTRRRGLSQETYRRLRDAIVSGELAPDEPLSEAALAERFEVSRTPVREALVRLADDGLVRNMPNQGSRVAGISLTDVKELFQIREALEALAVRLAAQSDERSRAEIPDLIAEFQRWTTVDDPSIVQSYYQLTARLDATIVRLAGNRWLENVLGDLWAHANRLRQFASHDIVRLRASAAEHIDILQAIAQGDPELAQKCLRHHLSNSRTALVMKIMGTL